MSYAKQLVGLTITDIRWDGDSITFNTQEKGDITANVYGDCCSHSWIDSVETPARGYPAVVQDAFSLDLPGQDSDPPSEDSGTYRKYYGLRIVTDNGDIDIDYRNDSNGYYGGSLDFPYVEGVEY